MAYQGSYQEISEAVVNYLETGMAEEDRKTASGSGVETDGDMESEQEKIRHFTARSVRSVKRIRHWFCL